MAGGRAVVGLRLQTVGAQVLSDADPTALLDRLIAEHARLEREHGRPSGQPLRDERAAG